MSRDYAALGVRTRAILDLVSDDAVRQQLEREFTQHAVRTRAEEDEQFKMAILEKWLRPANDLESAWFSVITTELADNLSKGILEIGGFKLGVIVWPGADDGKHTSP